MRTFTITDRDGKKALWIGDQNIWDLKEKELTEGVKKAIIMAYAIGVQHAQEDMREHIWHSDIIPNDSFFKEE
jgi:hypothetical protein